MTSDTTERHGTGGKLGQVAGRSNKGKPIVHTIDPEFILGIARISEFGARKYHMRNFLMAPGMNWSITYDSLMRHLMAWWAGEDDDAESGLPHLYHAAWNLMALSTYARNPVYHPGDDRPSTIEYVGGLWKDWESEFERIRNIDTDPKVRCETPAIDDAPEELPIAEAAVAPAFMRDGLREGMMRRNQEQQPAPVVPDDMAAMAAIETARVACNAAGFDTHLKLEDGKLTLTVFERKGPASES